MLNEQQFYSHPYGECSMVRFERLQISSYTEVVNLLSNQRLLQHCFDKRQGMELFSGGEET